MKNLGSYTLITQCTSQAPVSCLKSTLVYCLDCWPMNNSIEPFWKWQNHLKCKNIPLIEFYFILAVCHTHLHKVSTMFKPLISFLFICHIPDYEPSTQMIMNQFGDFCFPFPLGKCTWLLTLVCMILLMTIYNNFFYHIAVSLYSG